MKSIQSKIILLILTCIIVCAAVVGGAGVLSSQAAIDNDSVRIMNLLCSEKAHELNNTLEKIEQSVEILSVYTAENLEDVSRLSDGSDYLDEYTQLLDDFSLTAVHETEGAVAVYIRFNPEIAPSDAGLFRMKSPYSGRFENAKITDLDEYSPDDFEHVGWYWVPVNNGAATWLMPYYNNNINIYMISYVIPIYVNDQLIGIVGMDIDFNYITQFVDSIRVYDTGFAFLTDNEFNIIYHKNVPTGTSVREFSESLANAEDAAMISTSNLYEYTRNGVEKQVAFRMLDNGMCLAVTAPSIEIDSSKIILVKQIFIASFLIAVIFITISTIIARTIIHPLMDLNSAAKQIAKGNLNVSLVSKSKDEIGTLTSSLRETVEHLKIQIGYINTLAYIDKLTGISNNTAYLRDVALLKADIQNNAAEFCVVVIDVNGLKYINDNYGHDKGNELITSVAEIAVDVFGIDNVYRIGGDEFAVLLNNANSEKCYKLSEKFAEALKSYDGKLYIAAAIGTAVYDKNSDSCYESVFKRADEAMYKNKVEMKNRGESSRIKE